MNPKINFNNHVRQMLPPHRRQPVRLEFLRQFVAPLTGLFAAFDPWRDDIRMRMNLTGQIMVLEGYLRAKYDPSLSIRIVTNEDRLLRVGLKPEERTHFAAVGLKAERRIGVALKREIYDLYGDADFLVFIPAGVDIELIRIEVEKYRQAGINYKIIQSET